MVKNLTPVSATPPVQISAEASSDSNQKRNPVPLPKISFELQPERQSQFVDFDGDGVCKFIVYKRYTNGTIITGPISLTTANSNFVMEVNE